ncbi:MAG: hypothetical protein ACP5JO_01410 [Candidatus Ratteibacteria bacterium]
MEKEKFKETPVEKNPCLKGKESVLTGNLKLEESITTGLEYLYFLLDLDYF